MFENMNASIAHSKLKPQIDHKVLLRACVALRVSRCGLRVRVVR
jgi:hypothetical protein